jgi:hypothetical protein
MPKNPNNLRRFSHVELIEAIDELIKRRNLKLSTPSLPTVKSWSAKGLLNHAGTVQVQAQAAVERMLARPAYYNSEGRSRKHTAQAAALAQAVAPPMDSPQLQQALEQLTRLQESLDSLISNIAKTRAARPPSSGDIEGLVQSIEQIDAIRRHLLIRHDAEILLIKQNAGLQPGQGAPASAMGHLDLARMEGRLNRFEANQSRMIELLESLQPRN